MIYIGMFFLSIFFLEFAFILKKDSNALYKICIAVSIVIPCLLAALRSYAVGSDTLAYVSMFKNAGNTVGLSEYIRNLKSSWGVSDIAFAFINYIVFKLTNSVEVDFFVQEALIIIPVFGALFIMFKNKNQVIFGVVIFYLFCYNTSFNIVRQYIALSFELLAFAFLEKKDKKHFVIFLLISVLFHNSAIVAYGIYLLYCFIKTKVIKPKEKGLILLFLIIIVIGIIINIEQVLNFILSLGLLDYRYYSYTSMYLRNSFDVDLITTLIGLSVLILMLINKKMLSENLRYVDFYIIMLILGLVTQQASNFISYAQRISLYFYMPCFFIVLPQFAIKNVNYVRKKELIYSIAAFSIFLIYFVWSILINNSNQTLPYLFRE
ncbi:MAG: EpsG family protein [Eubacterium sp.]|nr:EpsG family protein [Eubacterium sp.]